MNIYSLSRFYVIAMAVACCLISCKPSAEKFGDEIVFLIEQFQIKHGRLPNDLAEIGIKDDVDGPVFYERKGVDEYILYYGARLGDSVVYDPKRREWK